MNVLHILLVSMLLVPLAGCRAAAGDGSPDPAWEAAARRAALASITVENRTDQPIEVAFQWAASTDEEVVLGRVAPDADRRMAPVPALEPIRLIARADGREHRLAPHTFEPGTRWRWVIDEREHYVVRADRGP